MPPLESGSGLPAVQSAQGGEGVAAIAALGSVEVVSLAQVVVVGGGIDSNLFDD